MSECSHQTSLEAYHDGQARLEMARQVEAHVSTCPACAGELNRLTQLSELLHSARPEGIRPDELARLHEAVEGVEDRGIVRMVFGLSAVAASILIISTAWLYDAPGSMRYVRTSPMVEQPWERMASAGQPMPAEARPSGTAMLNRDTIDWMIRGTGGQSGAR